MISLASEISGFIGIRPICFITGQCSFVRQNPVFGIRLSQSGCVLPIYQISKPLVTCIGKNRSIRIIDQIICKAKQVVSHIALLSGGNSAFQEKALCCQRSRKLLPFFPQLRLYISGYLRPVAGNRFQGVIRIYAPYLSLLFCNNLF